jgi:hypothetical protein
LFKPVRGRLPFYIYDPYFFGVLCPSKFYFGGLSRKFDPLSFSFSSAAFLDDEAPANKL